MTRDEADDIKRHFDVVAERLEGQIRQVAEGVVLNGERIGGVENRLDRLEARTDRLETELHAGFAKVNERADRFEGEVRAEFAKVNERADRFEGEVRAEFAKVNERADRFEGEVGANFAEVKSMIKFSYAELDRRISNLENVVTDLSHRVMALEGRSS